jgi:hypothetical protein
MIVVDGRTSYSATVDIRLLVGDAEYEVSQVAGNTFFLQEPGPPVEPGTHATLAITIDDDCFFRHITLHQGIADGQVEVTGYW